jgi:hypothetical protein
MDELWGVGDDVDNRLHRCVLRHRLGSGRFDDVDLGRLREGGARHVRGECVAVEYRELDGDDHHGTGRDPPGGVYAAIVHLPFA